MFRKIIIVTITWYIGTLLTFFSSAIEICFGYHTGKIIVLYV
jgi:hypothetical protein